MYHTVSRNKKWGHPFRNRCAQLCPKNLAGLGSLCISFISTNLNDWLGNDLFYVDVGYQTIAHSQCKHQKHMLLTCHNSCIHAVYVHCRMATRHCTLLLRKATPTWLSCCCSEEPTLTVDQRTTLLPCTLLLKRIRSQLPRSLYVTSLKLTRRQR